ncbi:NAD-P-binding protein [Lentinus tigrinus ALCF2SS1-7]|uniref:NAD-P-binding protein n=1 Tax=Lentinus tigrinus ALCF2SS1-6 TaxID=1328759 RepID=A0A5C2RZZ0_9APHY|nr:NAD-P-binding protein [Lentinus tigrinus ALCF2SS1-6]RPD71630.1 NAD-P-binding protein [Lentinus tigrinus ALCF2SS1-7]
MTDPRVWFITGTSSGIGRALVELILEEGENVIATVRSLSALDDLTHTYPSTRLLVLQLDVTHPDHIIDAFATAKAAFGRIDVVVNNAGWGDLGEVETMDEKKGRGLLETNFWGALHVTKEAIRLFRDDNPPGVGGRLLQMSSFLGLAGSPATGYYAASKFALEGITETLAAEIDPAWNIKITLLEPGWIRSSITSKIEWPPEHPSYSTNANLPTSVMRKGTIDDFVTWKNTRRSAAVFYKAASLPNPPLHLVVGKDAIASTRQKIASLSELVDLYESWSEGLED